MGVHWSKDRQEALVKEFCKSFPSVSVKFGGNTAGWISFVTASGQFLDTYKTHHVADKKLGRATTQCALELARIQGKVVCYSALQARTKYNDVSALYLSYDIVVGIGGLATAECEAFALALVRAHRLIDADLDSKILSALGTDASKVGVCQRIINQCTLLVA